MTSSDAVKDKFYDALNALLRRAKSSDVVVVAGEMNAQVGRLCVSEIQLGGRHGMDLVFDSRCLRTIARVDWYRRIRSEAFRRRVSGCETGASIEECIQHQKLRWLEHVLRTPNHFLLKRVTEAEGWPTLDLAHGHEENISGDLEPRVHQSAAAAENLPTPPPPHLAAIVAPTLIFCGSIIPAMSQGTVPNKLVASDVLFYVSLGVGLPGLVLILTGIILTAVTGLMAHFSVAYVGIVLFLAGSITGAIAVSRIVSTNRCLKAMNLTAAEFIAKWNDEDAIFDLCYQPQTPTVRHSVNAAQHPDVSEQPNRLPMPPRKAIF
ncbi:hypothetical protein T265_10824 [Opisthorchis viverrini]|uniref:Uncharacterized protein n=1 Tax=Opisthorchis viverrini TaxID=6198 RepID=A0A074Z174_OPIVI|nr:hypothetical protein T265_10824 [Opisthorchis viverrini]KER20693.1 hypothetical protein T265_10824 [Opisthorchis viverrini]